jgi:hypothetical protein
MPTIEHASSHDPSSVSVGPSRRIAVVAGAALIGGAVLANLAFVVLGAAFDYPDVLQRPTAEIATMFQADRTVVMAWFGVLALAAFLLAPAAIGLGRLGSTRAARWSVWAGVEAAVVQVIGLSRWFLLIPGLAATATDPASTPEARATALDRIELAHNVLGKGIGETLGYAFTAFWTILVIVGFRNLRGGRINVALGSVSAGMIALGMLTPLGVPGTDLANFLGYIGWSVWAIAFGIRILRRGASR